MATINYNGMELEEITKPQIFDPPKKCVVWSDNVRPDERNVLAVLHRVSYRVIAEFDSTDVIQYQHCALLPDPPKPRRATNRELARWIAEGKGEILVPHCVTQHVSYAVGQDNAECVSGQQVRKWADTEWHEPTVDYLFGGDK